MHVSDPELCLWQAVVCVVMMPPSLGMLLVCVSSLGGLPILSLPLNMATGILYLLVLLWSKYPTWTIWGRDLFGLMPLGGSVQGCVSPFTWTVHMQRRATVSRLTRKQREQGSRGPSIQNTYADSFSLALTGFNLLRSLSVLSNEIYSHPVFKPCHVLRCWGDRVNVSFAGRT